MSSRSLQFAILHDGAPLASWQLDCIERLQRFPDVQLRASLDLSEGAARADEILAQLRAHTLDFILNFASQASPAQLLEAARFGVWRFEFGDWIRSRGGPPGFWEVHDGEPVSAALLVREQPSADAVVILREGYLRTKKHSAAANRAQLLARFTYWPAQVCVDIRNGFLDRVSAPPLMSSAPARGAPSRTQRLVCASRGVARAAHMALRGLFRHEQWNVGVIDRPIASLLRTQSPLPVRWCASPQRDQFRADPFGIVRDGRLVVLCEQFDYGDNIGTIVSTEPELPAAPDAPVAIGPDPAVHLSYPYLFELDGRTLCIPETGAAGEIALYEATRFPDRWAKVAVLVDSVAIVDATLFRHLDRWWLAGSEVARRGDTSELHLWFAEEITGTWRAHPGNPVKVDVRSARPAGTPFVSDGVLYRPAQDCSTTYGAAVIVNRVELLTPTAFRESPAATIAPDPNGLYRAGLHTISSVGDVTLVDSKREIFVAAQFRRVLRHFLLQALQRLPGMPRG